MMRKGGRFRGAGKGIGEFCAILSWVMANSDRYFGRARELPGVKEMFEAATARPKEDKPLESRADLRKQVDASYYGYNLDEENGTLLDYEIQKEREAFENLLEGGDGQAPKNWEPLPGDAGDGSGWRLPTSKEVQEELVERRRRRLLDKLG
jgi:pre-mRNA-splicing factor ISY1